MELVNERAHCDGYPNVHCFNTYFYPKLVESGISGVKRWTKNVDLFKKRYVCVPVNINNKHWCMVVSIHCNFYMPFVFFTLDELTGFISVIHILHFVAVHPYAEEICNVPRFHGKTLWRDWEDTDVCSFHM